jgi:hypothetical protein
LPKSWRAVKLEETVLWAAKLARVSGLKIDSWSMFSTARANKKIVMKYIHQDRAASRWMP